MGEKRTASYGLSSATEFRIDGVFPLPERGASARVNRVDENDVDYPIRASDTSITP
jgi:hypothetical protein